LQSKIYEEIERVTDKMKRVEGIVGVVLFGSYSRGDFEEGSDIDLLVIFKNKTRLENQPRDIHKITSESGLFIQAICLTLEELIGSPLLQTVLREGRIYFADEEVKRVLTRDSQAIRPHNVQCSQPKS